MSDRFPSERVIFFTGMRKALFIFRNGRYAGFNVFEKLRSLWYEESQEVL